MTRAAIESPCVQVCTVEPKTGLCFGCGRSLKEIAEWSRYSSDARDEIMRALPDRLARLEETLG